jgi:hypothetical protein
MAQCEQKVEKRDTYRVNLTGRGPHFTLHYTLERCSRTAQEGSKYCWQHRPWHVVTETLEPKGGGA